MLGDDINGYDVIKQIREHDEEVPVIFTSARDQELDKIFGLELGSDDYITKPYSSKELVLRVNKIIKRVYKETENNTINYENYIIDQNKRLVQINNKELKLTTLEFDLLLLFVKNKGRCFSREEIIKSIWGNDYYGTDRAVDDLVRRLRKKLKELRIEAVYGYGYRLS
jgi:two-component system response regulator CssR